MLDLRETPCKPAPLLFLQCLFPTHCCALDSREGCCSHLFGNFFPVPGSGAQVFHMCPLHPLCTPKRFYLHRDYSVLWPAFWWASRVCVHVEEMSFRCQSKLWTSWDECTGVSEPKLEVRDCRVLRWELSKASWKSLKKGVRATIDLRSLGSCF